MRDKFFLPATLILCTVIFFGWQQLFYEEIQREILAAKLETRKLRDIEREISDLKVRHGNLATFAEAKEFELDAARRFLPPKPAQDSFIEELYRAAEFSRVSLISVSTGEVASEENFQTQIVNVKAEADYISLMNFLRETLDGERLVSLEKFSVTGAKILSCELRFKIFAASP